MSMKFCDCLSGKSCILALSVLKLSMLASVWREIPKRFHKISRPTQNGSPDKSSWAVWLLKCWGKTLKSVIWQIFPWKSWGAVTSCYILSTILYYRCWRILSKLKCWHSDARFLRMSLHLIYATYYLKVLIIFGKLTSKNWVDCMRSYLVRSHLQKIHLQQQNHPVLPTLHL